LTLVADSKAHSQCSPRPAGPAGGTEPRRESGAALRFLLVVLLLVGYGVASAHSHSHGQTGVSTCTICLVADAAADVPIQSLSSVAVNPHVAWSEPGVPDDLHGRETVTAERARSPPS
jgi:hypothetical protein